MNTIHRLAPALSILVSLASCTAPGGDPGSSGDPGDPHTSIDPRPARAPVDSAEGVDPAPREPLKPAPWTDRFVAPAVLVADRIRVEGPAGLLEHLALRSDDALFERTVKTLPEGFLQTVRPRVLADGGREWVRGQLDAWTLTATAEIVALERPGDVPVVVVAEGNAYWSDRDGQEQRAPRLVFEAPVEAEPEPEPEEGAR